jgi:hypothetical protein
LHHLIGRARCALRATSTLTDQPPLLLGKGGVEVEHERVGIDAELGDDERHALCHQIGDEGDVAGEPVEFGDDHRAALAAGRREGTCEPRPAFERVGALAGGRLDEAMRLNPAVSAKLTTAACCASMPRPERRCRSVETR